MRLNGGGGQPEAQTKRTQVKYICIAGLNPNLWTQSTSNHRILHIWTLDNGLPPPPRLAGTVAGSMRIGE